MAALSAATAQTPDQLFQQALDQFSADRPAAAEPLLRDALKARPQWFEARFVLGSVLVSLGRSDEAVKELAAAHRLHPTHLDCTKLLASEYLALERAGEALPLLKPLLMGQADEETLLLSIEAFHLRNAPGDTEEALRLCNRGLARFPKSAPMLTWRGFALREKGQLSDARQSLEAALKLAPEDGAAVALLADVARRQGSYPEALRLFNDALRLDPRNSEALVGKSRTLAAMDQISEALEALGAAVAILPGTAVLRLELSQLYSKLGNADAAAREAAEFRRLRASPQQHRLPRGLHNRVDDR